MIEVTDQERAENFFQAKYEELFESSKSDHIELMYLQKENKELRERVQKLASRQPAWPKGYRPQRERTNRR